MENTSKASKRRGSQILKPGPDPDEIQIRPVFDPKDSLCKCWTSVEVEGS